MRVVDVTIDAAFLAERLFRSQPRPKGLSWYEVDFPQDAQIIGVVPDPRVGIIRLRVESPSFPEVQAGELVPEGTPIYTTHWEPIKQESE